MYNIKCMSTPTIIVIQSDARLNQDIKNWLTIRLTIKLD